MIGLRTVANSAGHIYDKLKQLIIDMAKYHTHLGCRMLHGYLKYLGYKVSPATRVQGINMYDVGTNNNVSRNCCDLLNFR